MEWIKPKDYQNFLLKSCVLSIGNFDGLHIGHRQLISALLRSARDRGVPSLVLTFNPHPLELLKPEIQPQFLFSKQDLSEQLAQLGVDYLVEIPFTKELASMSADQFFAEHLMGKLKPLKLVVGYDFCFGRNKEGNINYLKKKTHAENVGLEVIEALHRDGQPISSSRIRKALSEGAIELVQDLLGRSFYKRGRVIKGQQQGRKLGFPTANIPVTEGAPLANGVYCTRTEVGGNSYSSITNVGYRPTLEVSSIPYIETHIFDQDFNLYDKEIRVHFLKFVRPEQKFSHIEDLKRQIRLDIESCKK